MLRMLRVGERRTLYRPAHSEGIRVDGWRASGAISRREGLDSEVFNRPMECQELRSGLARKEEEILRLRQVADGLPAEPEKAIGASNRPQMSGIAASGVDLSPLNLLLYRIHLNNYEYIENTPRKGKGI